MGHVKRLKCLEKPMLRFMSGEAKTQLLHFGAIVFFKESPKGVARWQKAWDLYSRSRVRVKTCTSCKNLGQPEFYSLTWTYKVRFPEDGVSLNSKKKKKVFQGVLGFFN
jgi:hypothetical protein